MSEPILQVQGLSGGYGASRVLFDVSFDVPASSVVAILGRNGAGKTTLLRTLLGFLPPTSGRVLFKGNDITAFSPTRLARQGVGYMPQEHVVFPSLTVEENLTLGLRRRAGRGSGRFDEAFELFPKLHGRLGQQAGTLSGGERKMVGLARVMLSRPELLVLDEPTEGVWHGVVDEILEALRACAARSAVLLVEQHFELAMELADAMVVLQRGEVALAGTPQSVRDDESLLSYLAPTASRD